MSDRFALWLLAGTLLLALLGLRSFLLGRAHTAGLRRRTQVEAPMPRLLALVRRLEERLRHTDRGRRLAGRLIASGVALSPLEFVAIATAVGLACAAGLSLLTARWLAALGGAGAVRLCWLYVEYRRGKRRDSFVAQLPELARVLSNGTSAGLSINGALQIATTELIEPARAEVTLVLEEVRIGQSLDLALSHLAERMPSRELGVLISTLVIQQRSGGDLVRALGDMAETLEARKDLIREVRTVMAGSVFTAWIVAGLGVATVLVLNLISPGVVDKMTSSPLGIIVIVVSGTLYATGFVLIRQVTRIET